MTTNDDSTKRVVDHAACRIASETCPQELLRDYDRLDEAQAEIERLQAELLTAHRTWAERCSAWSDSVEEAEAQRDAAYRAGQEAMRERCAALCDDWEEATYCAGWREMEQWAQHCAEAIRALEVES